MAYPIVWGVVTRDELEHMTPDQLSLATRVAQLHEKRMFELIKSAVNGGIYESFKGSES